MRRFSVTIAISICISVISFAKDTTSIISEYNTDELVSGLLKENIQQNIGREVSLHGMDLQMSPYIFKLYEFNGYQPIWSNEDYTLATQQVMTLLENSKFFGICEDIFPIDYIKHLQKDIQKQKKPQKIALRKIELEFIMSNTLFVYTTMLKNGLSHQFKYQCYTQDSLGVNNIINEIYKSINNGNIAETILNYRIKNAHYLANISELDFLLVLYRRLESIERQNEVLTMEDLQNFIEHEFSSETYLDNYLKVTCLNKLNDHFVYLQSRIDLKNINTFSVSVLIKESVMNLQGLRTDNEFVIMADKSTI